MLTYEGTYLSDGLQAKIVAQKLQAAGIPLTDAGLPAGVKVKHAVLADGSPVHAFFNFSGQVHEFIYPYRDGTDLLTGRAVAKSRSVRLPPWDLVIIKE